MVSMTVSLKEKNRTMKDTPRGSQGWEISVVAGSVGGSAECRAPVGARLAEEVQDAGVSPTTKTERHPSEFAGLI